MSWTRITPSKMHRQYKGCVIIIEHRHPHVWTWTVTHTDFAVSDQCTTLAQAQRVAVREADMCLEKAGD